MSVPRCTRVVLDHCREASSLQITSPEHLPVYFYAALAPRGPITGIYALLSQTQFFPCGWSGDQVLFIAIAKVRTPAHSDLHRLQEGFGPRNARHISRNGSSQILSLSLHLDSSKVHEDGTLCPSWMPRDASRYNTYPYQTSFGTAHLKTRAGESYSTRV